MNILQSTLLLGLVPLALSNCNQKKVKENNTTTTEQSQSDTRPVAGNYVTADYDKRSEGYDWVGVMVQNRNDSTVAIQVRSRADRKKPTCTLDTEANKVKDGVYQASLQGKKVIFTFNDSTLTIDPEAPQDEAILHFYCSGGASIAGNYKKIMTPLDSTQLEKLPNN